MFGFALLAGGYWFVAPAIAMESRVGLGPSVASSNDSLQGDVYILGPGDLLELNLFELRSCRSIGGFERWQRFVAVGGQRCAKWLDASAGQHLVT